MTLVRQFRGILPALDRRQPTDRFVLDGRNFLVDAAGPFAAFSTELITPEQIVNPEDAKTFRVGDEIFLFIADAVLRFDTISELYYPVFTFPLNTTNFPWSQARVGGVHYFTKKGSNVFSYNPFTDTWVTLTAFVITTPHAVTSAGGRLVIMGIDDVQWSAIDNGSDLQTDIEKGVGIQSLAIVGGGDPLAVLPTFDGFITYTSTGSMKSELVDAINPFRHFPLTGDKGLIPLSPYTVIEAANNEHILLSKIGFHITVGKVPEPFQALMGEFFRRKILPFFDLTNETLIKLTFNSDRQWFIVSLAESEMAFNYTIAYVLYIPRDEWGLFNRAHVGFGELSISEGPFKGFNFGFFCAAGCLHKFVEFPHIEAHPDGGLGKELPANMHHFHSNFTPPARSENGVIFFTTLGQLETFDETVFTTLGTDLYEFISINSAPCPTSPVIIEQASIPGVDPFSGTPFFVSSLIPNFNNVLLLTMNGDGTEGGTDMVDQSDNEWALTFLPGLTVQTVMDTDNEKFPGAATLLVLGAVSSQGIRLNGATTFQAFGTKDFTIEAWVYPTFSGGGHLQVIVGKWTGSIARRDWRLLRNSNDKLRFIFSENGSTTVFDMQSITSIAQDVWTFVVMQREGDDFNMWLDGVKDANSPVVDSQSIFAGNLAQVEIGVRSTSADEWDGNLGPLRITLDEAVYVGSPATIPVPTIPYHKTDPTLMISDLSGQSSLLEIGWRQVTPNFQTMDSFIDVGLFRVNTQEDVVDEFSLVNDVVVGMIETPDGQIEEDWLTIIPDFEEDWLVDDLENEDWGFGIFSGTVYQASIIGSLDGYNQYQDQFELMEERLDIVDASIDETTGRARYFTCYNNGTYHIIRIEALELDESFHLKVMDITPIIAGRV